MSQPRSNLYDPDLLPWRPEPEQSELPKTDTQAAQRELNTSLLDARVAFHMALAKRTGIPRVDDIHLKRLVLAEPDDARVLKKIRQIHVVESESWSGLGRLHRNMPRKKEENTRNPTIDSSDPSDGRSATNGPINRRLRRMLSWFWMSGTR